MSIRVLCLDFTNEFPELPELPTTYSTSIVLHLVILLPQLRCSKAVKVNYPKRCPSQCEWIVRADTFGCDICSGLRYHCLLDLLLKPVEACMLPMKINAKTVGCPGVHVHTDGEPSFRSSNTECSENDTGCPISNHTGYYTNELYRFPSCLQHKNESVSLTTEASVNDGSTVATEYEKQEKCGCKAPWIVFSVVCGICIVQSISFCFIYLRRRKKQDNPVDTLQCKGRCLECIFNHICGRKKHVRRLQRIAHHTLDESLNQGDSLICMKHGCEYCKLVNPMMFAAQSGKKEYVGYFVEVMDDLEIKDNIGLNILHYCVIHNWDEIFKKAVNKCPSLRDKRNRDGEFSSILAFQDESKEEMGIRKFLSANGSYNTEELHVCCWQPYREKVLHRGLDALLNEK